jgi:hypothetical protein
MTSARRVKSFNTGKPVTLCQSAAGALSKIASLEINKDVNFSHASTRDGILLPAW